MTIDRVSTINASRVINALYQRGVVSRPELSAALGMDRSTVSKIITTLADRRIITIGAKGSSTSRGGRRPEFLDINHRLGHVVGIELQTDRWFATGIDLRGDTLFALSGLVPEALERATDVLGDVAGQVAAVVARQSLPCLGAVVAMPGIIDPYAGRIVRSNPLNVFEPLDIEPTIRMALDVPVLVENDANACCWGELFRRRELAEPNFASVLIELRRTRLGERTAGGIGVGIGIVIDRHVHYGAGFSAGEFQSVFHDARGTSQFALDEDEARRIVSDDQILTRVFRELSRNLALLANTMALSEVVLVGDLARYRTTFGAILEEAIQENWSYDTQAQCSVRFTDFGRETVAFGAASMFVERLFGVPEYGRQTRDYLTGLDLLDSVYPDMAPA